MPKRRDKRPESILVVVATVAGEVLMLRRTQPADFWQSVTGSLGWGESPRQAALRELREETSIQAGAALLDLYHRVDFPILPAWRARYAPSAQVNREHWFALWLSGRRLIHRNPEAHAEHCWLTWPRAAQRASSWTNRDAILGMFQTGR